jgi:hypothetical protein
MVIDLADGDPSKGNFIIGSPLALAFTTRATARYCLGLPGWSDDLRHGLAMARSTDPMSYATVVTSRMTLGIALGAPPDERGARPRTAKSWRRSVKSLSVAGSSWTSYLSSRSAWLGRRPRAETSMAPYRSCARPQTINSARDSCWGGAFRRRVLWWKRCSTGGPKVTWSKPRPQSSDWRRPRSSG